MPDSKTTSGYTDGYVQAEKLPKDLVQASPRLQKRLIVCCDGTWCDGLLQKDFDEVTNVLRLARCITPEDRRTFPPTPQLVFYQSGIGTSEGLALNAIQGATGLGVTNKIREAYGFVAQNYVEGDEILLFGFSRGAFTARTIAALLADLGILTTVGMEDFYQVYAAYQMRNKGLIARKKAEEFLDKYRKGGPKAIRALPEGALKCVGVWDTVGSVGIPGFFPANTEVLGFPDTILSPKIQYAFHAFAMNETRKDFIPTKWHLPSKTDQNSSKESTKVFKQVWFAGSHSDVGGGYEEHDLSDITLIWMVANLLKYELVSIDQDYLMSIPEPKDNWGEMKPTDSRTGLMALTWITERKVPTKWDPNTREMIHRSVQFQKKLDSKISTLLKDSKNQMVEELLPFETKMREKWASLRVQEDSSNQKKVDGVSQNSPRSIIKDAVKTLIEVVEDGRESQGLERRQNEILAHRALENPEKV